MIFSVEFIAPLYKTYKCEIFLGLCSFILAYVTMTAIKKTRSNFPPGPKGLPLLGYLPFLIKYNQRDFMRLGNKYGDVFSVKCGLQDFVVLHGGDVILEAFNRPEFLARPTESPLEIILPSSVFFSGDFNTWHEQRRIVVQFMKDLGLGKSKIEEHLVEEISHFLDFLRNSDSRPIDIKDPLCSSISNNISLLVFGKRYKYDDPIRRFLNTNMTEFGKNFRLFYLDLLFPWIRYLPFADKFLLSHKSRTAVKNFEEFFLKEINEHIKTFNPAHIRDFIDRYLLEIQQREKQPNTSFNQKILLKNVIDLFIAASETVENSLLWFVYLFAAYPDVQKRVRKEIMDTIGPDKIPEFMDMKLMPYTRAVMMEIRRTTGIGTMSLLRCAMTDTTLGGYNIPKGTTIIPNSWAVNHDPRNWDEPQKFKPERFLSKDGKSVIKPSHFIPFATGRRICPGETMANMELFLYITSILREFDIAFPDETVPTFTGNLYVTYRPQAYLVRFIQKKNN